MPRSFSRPSCCTACVAILLCSLVPNGCADSILGVTVMAGLSHQLNILRIGQELAVRGHNFSVLLSSTDAISIDALKKRSFPGLDVVTFEGPVHVGTEAWASSLSRDSQEVPRISRTLLFAATSNIYLQAYFRLFDIAECSSIVQISGFGSRPLVCRQTGSWEVVRHRSVVSDTKYIFHTGLLRIPQSRSDSSASHRV